MNDGDYGCGKRHTWAVCSKAEGNTAQDLCDMAGNVWERVADFYDERYYGRSARSDPTGPAGGSSGVIRGGGWSGASERYLRAAYRDRINPGDRREFLGFRCARD